MNTEKIILSSSEEETEEVGFNLAKSLPRGSEVLAKLFLPEDLLVD